MSIEYETAASLSYNRFSLDTNSEFYQAEMAYYDEVGPLFADLMTKVADMMLSCPFRKELESLMNPRIFLGYEIAKKSFAPCITEDMPTISLEKDTNSLYLFVGDILFLFLIKLKHSLPLISCNFDFEI